MPTLDCTTRREDGVTLVACRLSNDRDAPCRVRIEPAVDRIAPPRRKGLPAPGWSEGRYETVVPAGATVGVGFATPDRPSDPPAALTVLGEDADPMDDGALEPTPTGAARSLLDPRPPREAVSAGASRSGITDGERDEPTDGADAMAGADTAEPGDGATATTERTRGADGSERADGRAVPPAVAAWLARVERRENRAVLGAVAAEVASARRRIDAGEP